ncbi:MAG: twin-arginine translocase subunit TatC [Acidobacteria bacterium]|nr:twin-arginine translocase subunit TatC [Acidobacteriota bacterium]NIM61123.1 twin-arginine translocase subunit TatC [Acidobacteriota bacterium]NIO58713.1 twin-arginine translocase subunit TatC [Acidobacteriota bacterium]NIQ29764.1 twin-arginine translocase subunit TatC [Acidobacteriota bacterium]NIQ84484.1 twin-arginine translocase subunit TatC [Acidobacteriota bacterium]
MSLLEHLDELRSRLFKALIGFLVTFGACWAIAGRLLEFLVAPIRQHMFEGGEIVFINMTEPFTIYMKASALAALFVSAPWLLYQLWAFVSPGLYPKERRMVAPFIFFGTLFFVTGGWFGYVVATPTAARWLLRLGGEFHAQITLRSAFGFESWIILGMGLVFELPVVIFFLSRVGLVTPGFLMRHFKIAVMVIAVLSAVLTPTGDIPTMAVFAVPMILLYLLGVAVAWIFGGKRRKARE